MRATPPLTIASGFQTRTVVIVAVVLVALAAVYAARQPSLSSRATAIEPVPSPPNEGHRFEAAHVTACAAIQRAVGGTMTFDRQYVVEPLEDGKSRLTTTATVDGRKVRVRSVLQWDDGRQAWDVRELYLGGTAVPLFESNE